MGLKEGESAVCGCSAGKYAGLPPDGFLPHLAISYPPGAAGIKPRLASLDADDCAPGLGVPGGTAGPTGAVGATGGIPRPALGITSGGKPGGPIIGIPLGGPIGGPGGGPIMGIPCGIPCGGGG